MAGHEIEVDGEIYVRKSAMVVEIQSEDRRRALVALRDYLVHELSGHRCSRCEMSQLKTGDTAALVLRLQKILDDIESIPKPVETGQEPNVVKINASKTARMQELREKQAKAKAADERRDNPPRRTGGRR